MPWNPEQYEQFKQERFAPFYDLVALIDIKPDLKVIDLGCGTGELTATLANDLPNSQVLGIDASEEMLSKTQRFVSENVCFRHQNIESMSDTYDLIFSHAALQWIDNHAQLFTIIWSHLNPGGQILIQMPSNHNHVTHRLIQTLAATPPFALAINHYQRVSPVLQIDDYARLLYQLGAIEIQVFEKIYPHILENADALLEWVKGTAMVPYLERLSPDLQEQWFESYRREINSTFSESPVFYPFRRILISAKKMAA